MEARRRSQTSCRPPTRPGERLRAGLAILAILLSIPALAAQSAPSANGAAPVKPTVLYLDVVAGPSEGGENGLGGYLSIFGQHFSDLSKVKLSPTDLGSRLRVRIGGHEVARYLYFGPSHGLADVQQITVQIGALGQA